MSEGKFHYKQERLENDLVALEIFEADLHADLFVEAIKADPETYAYVSLPPMATKQDFLEKVYNDMNASPEYCMWAIIDKTKPADADLRDRYAGVVSLNATSKVNAVTEIGIIVSPKFHRTHVATNAVGLALLYTLDPPSKGGLGLRRVEWRTHSGNAASRRAALRMGFEFEGITRWARTFENKKLGEPVEALKKRNGATEELPGRHTVTYSIVWDEWDDDKRPKLVALMERKVAVE